MTISAGKNPIYAVLAIALTCALAVILVTPVPLAAQETTQDDAVVDDEDGEGAEGGEAQTTSSLQRGGRMEFDARVIRGERAGSGAVFLFQRPPRPLPSMIERRTSYLEGTVHRVFGEDGVNRLEESREAE